MKCPQCGKEFIPVSAHQKFCCYACGDRYRHGRPKPKPKSKGKSLDDWAREAAECNLDYGTYRALIQQGKSFDELKATADSRHPPAHQRNSKNCKLETTW